MNKMIENRKNGCRMNIPFVFLSNEMSTLKKGNERIEQSICHKCTWMTKKCCGEILRAAAWISFYKRRPRRPPFLRVESDGMGVTSSIRPIFIPARAKARRADWAPGPGVLVLLPPVARSLMCKAVMPNSLHFSATSCNTDKY